MPTRFRFRLEQVLNLRKQLEEQKVRELAQAQGRLLEIEEELRGHEQEEGAFLGSYGRFEEAGTFSSDQVMAFSEYRDWLSRRKKEMERREREWAQEVERRRQTAMRASRGRRLLENLKEKRAKQHAQEVLGEEQRFLDEIASIAFVRRDRVQRTIGAATTENLGR
ncbi:MAG TPA: flagellar export protein FliJ [bacterium]|nr:flagellar export protein FliJ [bacterium]